MDRKGCEDMFTALALCLTAAGTVSIIEATAVAIAAVGTASLGVAEVVKAVKEDTGD